MDHRRKHLVQSFSPLGVRTDCQDVPFSKSASCHGGRTRHDAAWDFLFANLRREYRQFAVVFQIVPLRWGQ
jgi:hypothetical protein